MTCPLCGGELVAGGDRCPVCDAGGVPRVEGALAADPRLVTPPARGRSRAVEPLRDIPGLRRKERTWRDEVQERVRSRRQRRADAGLPLFDAPETAEVPPPSAQVRPSLLPDAAAPRPQPVVEGTAPAPPPRPQPIVEGTAPAPPRLAEHEPDLVSTRLSEAELADLPLLQSGDMDVLDREVGASARSSHVPSLDDEVLLGDGELQGEVNLKAAAPDPTPVERPARPVERVRAATVDALLFAALAGVVLYFTGRAARVEVLGLVSAWPYLAAYLGLLGLFYAGYFTGTTGQTPGKLATGLRVVDAAGRPPGYLRAMARALVGLLGTGLAGLGLVPMAFDPAARALHDRLFRTRVVRH